MHISYTTTTWTRSSATLEERRNRQDLIEVFKMCNGMSRLKLNEFFTLADNNIGTRGHSRKLAKFRCTRDCCKYFFSNRVINRWNQLDQRAVEATSINAFKGLLSKIRETRMGFFMDWSAEPWAFLVGFWPVGPHKVSDIVIVNCP